MKRGRRAGPFGLLLELQANARYLAQLLTAGGSLADERLRRLADAIQRDAASLGGLTTLQTSGTA